MTKEKILARIENLENQRLDAVAQVNAIMGAIQDCQFWLAQLDKQEAEPPKSQPCP